WLPIAERAGVLAAALGGRAELHLRRDPELPRRAARARPGADRRATGEGARGEDGLGGGAPDRRAEAGVPQRARAGPGLRLATRAVEVAVGALHLAEPALHPRAGPPARRFRCAATARRRLVPLAGRTAPARAGRADGRPAVPYRPAPARVRDLRTA